VKQATSGSTPTLNGKVKVKVKVKVKQSQYRLGQALRIPEN
jgi:hypothetical protein